MYFLGVVLAVTTILLCYAGYVFLIVDKRQQKQIEESPEVFSQLDDKEYLFGLPAEVEEYEELRDSKPADNRFLPVALLKRAMADIPRIEVRRAAPLSPARCRESHTPCGPRSNSRRTIRGWRVSSTAACCRLASGSSFSRPRP